MEKARSLQAEGEHYHEIMRQKIKVRLQPTVASSSKPTLSNQPTPPRYPVASVAAAEEKEDGAVELTPVRVARAGHAVEILGD
jgi:hypothetical protein